MLYMVQSGNDMEKLSALDRKRLAEDLSVLSEMLDRVEPYVEGSDGAEFPPGYPIERLLWETQTLMSELGAVFRDGKHMSVKIEWVNSKNGGKNG